MVEEAIAKAKAIAAKLSGAQAPIDSDLGKRKNRWDEDNSLSNYGLGLGLMQRRKVYIPHREHPEINFLGLLIGPRGRTQKDLESRTGAKIIIRGRGAHKDGTATGHPDDDDELHVAIEGPGDSAQRALEEIEEILFNPQQAERLKQEQLRNLAAMNTALVQYTPGLSALQKLDDGEGQIELHVPNHLVGYLIGKGGENIQKMQYQCGVHMQIAKESDMRPGDTLRQVILRGPLNGVTEAKRRVDDLIADKMKLNKGKKELDNYSFILKIAVPNDKVGIVIGKGGATVKTIQDKTQAIIYIPPGPDEDNPAIRTFQIGGDSKDIVEQAQMEIFLILQQQQQLDKIAPLSAVYLTVPDDKVGIVIGKNGITIKDIQARTQTKVQIPPGPDPGTNPPVRTLSIHGEPQDQFQAKFEIENILGIKSDTFSAIPLYGAATMPGMYGYDPASMYGGTTGLDYYSAAGYASQYATTSTPDPTSTNASVDPAAYYNDFWQYAAYYGETAARAYYTTWSPPEGSKPPEGWISMAPSGTTDVTSTPAVDDAANAEAWAKYNEQYAQWFQQQQQETANGQPDSSKMENKE